MLQWILGHVICDTFTHEVGGSQFDKIPPKGLFLNFAIPTKHDVEDGYRHRHLLLFGEGRYIGVYTREEWNVRPFNTLEYEKGQGKWEVITYHDSCWRDGVKDFLNNNLITVGKVGNRWFEIIDIDESLSAELKLARKKKYET